MTDSERVPAYGGLLVADLSGRLSGAFAARLFADHGADVVLLEPPEGHPLRREAPFLADEPGLERSALHAYANWNKRSVVLDAPAAAAAWLAAADLVITTDGPTALQAWPLSRLRSSAVHLSVTPFGLDNALADAPAGNLTLNARSGWAYVNALREEPPIALPSRQAGYAGGFAAFIAAAAALRRRAETAAPELVDVRELEALTHTGFPWVIPAVYEEWGWSRAAAGGRTRGEPGPLYDAADGRMNFGFGDWHHWEEAMLLFNLPDQAARTELHPHGGRYSQDLAPVQAGVARELINIEKWPLFHKLAALRCISGVLQTIPELVENEQHAARQFFVETEIAGETVRASGDPHPMSPPSWSLAKAAPALGADNEAAPPAPAADITARQQTAPTQSGPLDGVRILTFTQAWSGTFGTELLAFLGADVVQIEALQRVDIWRTVRPHVPEPLRDPARTQHAVNTQGLYNAVNLNKRGLTLDLNTERGKALFWKLAPQFDVICENFRPGVLAGWGITLETLAAQRPDVIFASISGYGQSGPYAAYPANGATTEPMSGLSSLHGYEGDGGMNTAGLYPDPIAGYSFAAAVVAALARRGRIGGPQQIDVSMLEAMGAVVGDAVVEHDATGRLPVPIGNRDRQRAPHNIYPAAGEDEWIAVAVETEAQWQELCKAMEMPQLAADHRFHDAPSRKLNEAALDEVIGGWTVQQDAGEAEAQLQAHGVDAARVQPMYNLFADPSPHFQTSGFIQAVDHPEVGPSWLPGAPWRFSGAEDRRLRPAPCVGEHSFEVLSEDLGLSAAEYRELVKQQISGTMDDLAAAPD